MRPRPMSVMIFGILNIGFALFDFVNLLISRLMLHAKMPGNSVIATLQSDPSNATWVGFSAVVTGVFVLMLLAAGTGLLLTQSWARLLSLVYSVVCMIYVLVSTVVNYSAAQVMLARVPGLSPGLIPIVTLIVTLIGLLFGLAYPVLLLYFMTRPKVIAAFQPEPPAAPVPPGL